MPAHRFVRRLVVAAALGGAVTVALALSASLPATLDALGRFQWSLGPVVVGATLVNYALRFLKWEFYLRRLAVPPPRPPSLPLFPPPFTPPPPRRWARPPPRRRRPRDPGRGGRDGAAARRRPARDDRRPPRPRRRGP